MSRNHPDIPLHGGILAWFAGNPVAANLLMLLILAGGVLGMKEIDKEVFPRFSEREIEITALYPGSGPSEIEESVCIPIEEAIYDLTGIKHLHDEIFDNKCKLTVEIHANHDIEQVMALIRGRIQALQRLPKQVEKIDVQPAGRKDDDGVIWVALHGATDAFTLQKFGDLIEEQLAAIPGVNKASNYGRKDYEVSITVSPEQLRRYRLTLDEVAQAIRKASVDQPGGLIKNPDGELQLRVNSLAKDKAALGALIIKTLPDGNRLRLDQIADIQDGLEERLYEWRHNGETTQGWEIHSRQDTVAVARQVKAYVDDMRNKLPEGLSLITWWDDSQAYDERINTLLEDAFSGFVLVFLVLALFLRLRVALWAGIGIFTSVLGAFCLMPALDISLNMLSLFGFLLALGILVDDAIIIGESIHSRQTEGGERPLQAAINGVKSVALPVTLSVLVALAAFLPGLFLPGWAGQLMRPICLVMILTLIFSLVEALLILPSHLAADIREPEHPNRFQRLREALNQALDRFIARIYQPALSSALSWRYLTAAVFAALIVLTIALISSGRVRLSVNPDVTKDSFWVSISLPQSSPYSETRALADKVQDALFALRDELDGNTGSAPTPDNSVITGVETIIWDHGAGLWLELSPTGRQQIHVEQFIRDWRQRIGDIGRGKVDFIFKEGDEPYDIELMLSSNDSQTLTGAAEMLKQQLGAFPGVYDVIDSSEPGKPEIGLQLKPAAEQLGLRVEQLAEQVRHGYYGDEVHRFLRGRQEVKVMVRYPLEYRQSLDQLKTQPIRLPNGQSAALGDLAEIKLKQGYAQINREDRKRVLKIQARIDPTRTDVNEIYTILENRIFDSVRQNYPAAQLKIGQKRQEQQALISTFTRNTLIALLVIYVLIAVPFKSYGKPLIFLLAAPVAWCGAVLAHWAAGLPLSMESLTGMIAASGVVVNDSLVLMDYIRQHGHSNERVEKLIVDACVSRFRPILLAFLTNFAGFLPTLLETSPQAQFLIPMTLSLSAGLLIGMFASLILTPVCYAILEERHDPAKAAAPSPAAANGDQALSKAEPIEPSPE